MAKHTHSRLALALTIAACAAGVVLLAITIAAGDIASAAGLAFTVIVFAVGAAIGDGAPVLDKATKPRGGEMERRTEFDDWVREHTRALHSIAYLRIGDLRIAEEVVNDTLLALWRKWDDVEDPFAYAVGVMRNRNASIFRRARRRPREVEWDDSYAGTTSAVDNMHYEALAAAMLRLPKTQREVLVVRYWLGMTQKEGATFLGLPEGTIKSRETRAKKRLGLDVPDEIARAILKHLEG